MYSRVGIRDMYVFGAKAKRLIVKFFGSSLNPWDQTRLGPGVSPSTPPRLSNP